MKKISEKIIIIMLIVFICGNFVFSPVQYANTSDEIQDVDYYVNYYKNIIHNEIYRSYEEELQTVYGGDLDKVREIEFRATILGDIDYKQKIAYEFNVEFLTIADGIITNPSYLQEFDETLYQKLVKNGMYGEIYERVKTYVEYLADGVLEDDVNLEYNYVYMQFFYNWFDTKVEQVGKLTERTADERLKSWLEEEKARKESEGLSPEEIKLHFENLANDESSSYYMYVGSVYFQLYLLDDYYSSNPSILEYKYSKKSIIIEFITEEFGGAEDEEEILWNGHREPLEIIERELEEQKNQKAQEYLDDGTEVMNRQIKVYFEGLKAEIDNQNGEFWNRINNMRLHIRYDSEKSLFLTGVIQLLDNYIETYGGHVESATTITEDTTINWGTALGAVLDSVLGFLVYPWKAHFVLPGLVVNFVLIQIGSVGESSGTIPIVTLESILFNELAITDVNIFSYKTANGADVSDTILNIRQQVANWYYAFRNFAIAVSLAVLLYIGIKMAISSVAEKQAKYKQMLFNWVTGFALIFILHYIIIIVLNINTMLVNSMNPNVTSEGQDFMNTLLLQAFGLSLTKSWGAAIMYSILLVITFMFLMNYIKRMLMVCFLIIIAPLITMLYAIDKSGNNKSETLNTWLKEFCYNVLIQPFHCITYIVFVGTAMNVMYTGNGSLLYNSNGFAIGDMFFAIVCILCIFVGEKMIRTIFGFNKSKSVAEKIFKGAVVTNAINDVKRVKSATKEDEEESKDETPPALMSDGSRTDDVLAGRSSIPITRQQTEEDPDRSESGRAQQATNTGSTGTPKKPKANSRAAIAIKGFGKSYMKAASNALGFGVIKQLQENAEKRAKKGAREAFLIEAERYRQFINPDMTDIELANKTEAIMNTPMSELTTAQDIIYKQWIAYAQKSGVVKNPKQMRELLLKKEKQGRRG